MSKRPHRFNGGLGGASARERYGSEYFQYIGRLGAARSAAVRRQQAEADGLTAIQVYITAAQLEFLDAVMDETGQSRSFLIRDALTRWQNDRRKAE
jgi:hypothetical protein